jgi:tripartite-type tricarboxylate transporter receptor subunit TctC
MNRMAMLAVVGVLTLGASAQAQIKDPLLAQCSSIRMIVPYTAGGGGDVGARLLAPYVADDLGVPVQVENLPGAGSQTGITALARAPANGCTLGWTHLPATITIYLDPTRGAIYNRQTLEPVAMYVIDPGGIAVKGDSPMNTLADLVAAARARPGQISLSDSGVLSDGHLLALELEQKTGVKFAIVHGRGGAEGTADLLGGHIHAMAMNLGGPNMQLAASKQIKMLAVFTDGEIAAYPGVKTAKAQGFPILSSTSRAISAPGGTPRAVVDRLSQSVGKAMALPEFQTKAKQLGLDLAYMDSRTLAAYWDEMERTFKPLIAEQLSKQ